MNIDDQELRSDFGDTTNYDDIRRNYFDEIIKNLKIVDNILKNENQCEFKSVTYYQYGGKYNFESEILNITYKFVDKHILHLSDRMIDKIQDDLNIDISAIRIISKMKNSIPLLCFIKNSKSLYTLNLLTLTPTKNSPLKKCIGENIKNEIKREYLF